MVGWHHRLDGHMSLSKLWEIVKDWEAWHAVVQDITETHTTEQLNNSIMKKNSSK